MTKEQKYIAELKKLGIYETAFDGTIHALCVLEREQSRTRKAWKATAEPGGEPSTLDQHYEMILRQDRMIHALRESLGLTPKGLRRLRAAFVQPDQEDDRQATTLELIRGKRRAAG